MKLARHVLPFLESQRVFRRRKESRVGLEGEAHRNSAARVRARVSE